MRRLSTELPFTCVTCELEIVGAPVFHVGLPFCCAGCVADGPCTCSYDKPVAEGAGAGAGAADPSALARPAPADVEETLVLSAR
jgi:hypothetical protein